jgi:hypothetical protein
MIHMHSMLASASGNNAGSGLTRHSTLSQATLDNFQSALSDAVSSTLEKFGIDPGDVKISITPNAAGSSTATPPSSNTPVRTTPPTPGTPSSGTGSGDSSASGSTSGAPNGGYDPFLQAAFDNPFKNPPPVSTTPSSSKTASTDPQQAFDDAYWAKQPAAVQQLRNMQDPQLRTSMATQLASEGYSIDVPIMVWGWDPSVTTSMRQADGYTWVPSALQQPVEMAPGLGGMPGMAAYDPKNPPPGSIAV